MTRPLDLRSYRRGVRVLADGNPSLGAILRAHGEPPFWTHPAGFPGLLMGILGQQVSLESANAVFARLASVLGEVRAGAFLALDDATLRATGFSRQKADYARGVARAIDDGTLDVDALARAEDEEVRARLVALRGVGPWTADVYLLFALRRADAWPSGDLALITALHEARVTRRPIDAARADRIATRWRPRRAIAARLLWHHYLSTRGRGGAALG